MQRAKNLFPQRTPPSAATRPAPRGASPTWGSSSPLAPTKENANAASAAGNTSFHGKAHLAYITARGKQGAGHRRHFIGAKQRGQRHMGAGLNSAGIWIKPPPPTAASIKPAMNAISPRNSKDHPLTSHDCIKTQPNIAVADGETPKSNYIVIICGHVPAKPAKCWRKSLLDGHLGKVVIWRNRQTPRSGAY